MLLAAAALLPALARAVDETYQGVLEPANGGAKIPIVIVLRDLGLTREGTVTTSAPYEGSASIDSSENVYGHCSLNAGLTSMLSLRLYGPCGPESFTGSFTLLDKQKRAITRGSFSLPAKAAKPVKLDGRQSTSPMRCLNANVQCLTGCPREDEAAESACANRCRTKLQTCKAQTKKTAPLFPNAD